MTQKLTSDEFHHELSWEEAVSRYLEDHPDYFLHHPETIVKLILSHDVGDKAVSLIERQVQVLRQQNQNLQQQLRELVHNARENDVLGDRLHRFAIAMTGGGSPDEVLDTAYDLLRQEFRLDGVTILFLGKASDGARREFVAQDDKRLNALLKQFDSGKPICGGKHDESLMGYLFGERATEIKSSALIPLGDRTPRGVLALGTHDPHRFHPGMGTVYLTRLGELLAHGMTRHLA